MPNDTLYDAWEKDDHVAVFDCYMYYPRLVLRRTLGSFNEFRLLRNLKKDRNEKFSLLDIGCATGEFYRYFKSVYPKIDYYGCDISKKAVERARLKFPGVNFFLVDKDLKGAEDALGGIRPDVIFCRDVIIHQVKPLLFLQRIYDIAAKFLILRLRTRDTGETVFDTEISCQTNYGIWAPYIIFNCDEITSFIKTHCPDVCNLTFVKHYIILGGQYNRYLPKDCYLPQTKTSETALLIEKTDTRPVSLGLKVSYDNEYKAHTDRMARKICSIAMPFLIGRNYSGKVWW